MNTLKPGLSVCMIVKNEEKNIENAIKSFNPFADEIIVNDTGSVDMTREKLYRMPGNVRLDPFKKVRFIESEWKDDFSYSRNLSIDKASHQWIMWLDADDIVPEKSIESINTLKTAPLDRCFRFRIKNTISGIPLGAQFMQLRMFPNRPDIRFQGGIHEQIGGSCYKAGLEQFSVETEIYHTGYDDKALGIAKTNRNLRLMELHGYGKDSPTEACAVAAAYYRLERWKEGIARYTDVFEKSKINPVNHSVSFQLPSNIGMGYHRLKEYDTAISWFKIAHKDNIEATYQIAQCYEELGKFNIALECYLAVLDMPEVLLLSPQDYHYCKMHSFHRAWILMIADGQHERALDTLESMHNKYPKFRIPNA